VNRATNGRITAALVEKLYLIKEISQEFK